MRSDHTVPNELPRHWQAMDNPDEEPVAGHTRRVLCAIGHLSNHPIYRHELVANYLSAIAVGYGGQSEDRLLSIA